MKEVTQEVENAAFENDSEVQIGYETTEDEVPRSYFYSARFIGSWLAIGFFAMGGFGGFGLIAPVLSDIKADIGPDTGSLSNWLALVYTLCLAVGSTLVGRITDIFGRRWFFIIGAAIGMIGAIVCATAKNLPICIGGQTLIGVSSAISFAYPFAIAELVPVRARFYVTGSMYIFSIPVSPFTAATGTAFVLYTEQGWRWCYWMLLIINGIAAILLVSFYYPPTFHMKHGADSKMLYLKNFDYVGLFLYTAGLVLFILGINWGGSQYPWKSAAVISTIVIGLLCLASLFIYETKARLKESLIPMHIFLDRAWIFSILVLAIGASIYYSMAIVWPIMSTTVYTGDRMTSAWIACASAAGTSFGAMASGAFSKYVGWAKYQCIVSITIGGVLIASCANSTEQTKASTIARVALGTFAVGWTELQTQTLAGICIKDVRDIGVATGLAGSIRSAISAVAQAIYITVLSTRLTTTIPAVVVPAVEEAGLPQTSVLDYLAAASQGTAAAFANVQGITPQILAAGAEAYKVAYAQAFKTVFLTTIAFSAVAVVLSLWIPNVERLMTNKIGVTLHGRSGGLKVAASPDQEQVDPSRLDSKSM
ncbi:hypothetical protein LTS07_009264 [Exophiala sideris]|nr:hypothetical protein LTS07_009264 [Exophiala sideris]